MNPNPTPKTRFLESADNIKHHKALLGERSFDRSIDVAMLQFARYLADNPPPEMGGAASNWLRLQGAHEFVSILKGLADTPPGPPRIVTPNLNHAV